MLTYFSLWIKHRSCSQIRYAALFTLSPKLPMASIYKSMCIWWCHKRIQFRPTEQHLRSSTTLPRHFFLCFPSSVPPTCLSLDIHSCSLFLCSLQLLVSWMYQWQQMSRNGWKGWERGSIRWWNSGFSQHSSTAHGHLAEGCLCFNWDSMWSPWVILQFVRWWSWTCCPGTAFSELKPALLWEASKGLGGVELVVSFPLADVWGLLSHFKLVNYLPLVYFW